MSSPPPIPLIPINQTAALDAVSECQIMAAAITEMLDAFTRQASSVVKGWQGHYRGIFDADGQAIGAGGAALASTLSDLATSLEATVDNILAENQSISFQNGDPQVPASR